MENPQTKTLFENAMKDRWKEVYAAYQQETPDIQTDKIDKSDDTVLHVAVLKGNVDVVKELVRLIKQGMEEKVLGAKNERGNTPLHLAAALGFIDMCRDLTGKFPGAIKLENNDKETPFFLSARFGKKDVFLHLYEVCNKMPEVAGRPAFLFSRSDGDTILHSALNGEYVELAYEIIRKYKSIKEVNVIDRRDGHGCMPLHVLANKPRAFESGNPPGISDWLLYQCVILNLPKIPIEADETAKKVRRFPPNYDTCMLVVDCIRSQLDLVIKNLTCFEIFFVSDKSSINGHPNDVENLETTGCTPFGGQKQPGSHTQKPNKNGGESRDNLAQEDSEQYYPLTYETIVHFLKFIVKLLFVVLGFGIASISEIQERKKKHYWANLVMRELIEGDTTYHREGDGGEPKDSRPEELDLFTPESETTASKPSEYATTLENIWDDAMGKQKETPGSSLKDRLKDLGAKIHKDVNGILDKYDLTAQEADGADGNTKRLRLEKRDSGRSNASVTPFLVAARMGITEIVDGLLEKYPTAIHDMDPNGKNALLLAVEHRRTDVWNLLLDEKVTLRERLLRQVDDKENNALHLAATYGEHQPRTPGVAMQMQWEMKWFEFVKKAMPTEYRSRRNKKRQTPRQVLIKSHEGLAAKAGEWITKTSESCSVVAALISTVAFATSATIPGGYKESGEAGVPNLEDRPLFHVFAISSLLALCLSVTSLVLFLSVLTSRFQVDDFTGRLPRKLLFGLTSLFASIIAILVSFCAGHFFLLKESVKNAAYPIYFATCLPVTYFGLAQLHLYVDLLKCIFLKEPQPSYIMD